MFDPAKSRFFILTTSRHGAAFSFKAHKMAKAPIISNSFDFDSFDTATASEQGAELEVQHPVNGPTGLFIRVQGTNSERVKAELKRISNRAKASRNGTVRKDDEDESPRFLAAITLGWRTKDGSPVKLLGEELPFTPENAFRVYKGYPVIAAQVQAFVFDEANFIKG